MIRIARPATAALCRAACVLGALMLMAPPPAQARGPWHATEQNTPGWGEMSHRERMEHQRRLRGLSRYADCANYEAERQRRRGPGPADLRACDELRAAGRVR